MGDLLEMCSPGGNQGKRNFNNKFEPEFREPNLKRRGDTYTL
jgi:hypothetical protein